MKKKRFIKLLMAMGCSRNEAEAVAAIIVEHELCYEAVFLEVIKIILARQEKDERLRRLVNANFGDKI